MQKVSFFNSIHVKLVLIYVLLIIIALQIIGLYFSKELEENLKMNFQDSIFQRIDLVQYSIREEMLKERDENSPSIGQSLSVIIREFATGDINEIRVIDDRNRVLATSDINNQSIVGQRGNHEIVNQSITAQTAIDKIVLDAETQKRVWILATPIFESVAPNGEILGTIYIESNIENVFDQVNDINRFFS
ncbi:histidine kinase OS=Ureibacillus acetophenoni OX=614649 GN=SAMN05877842_105179 PE=4 SV=1 [Ureibacillus acetophenoni]